MCVALICEGDFLLKGIELIGVEGLKNVEIVRSKMTTILLQFTTPHQCIYFLIFVGFSRFFPDE